MAGETINPFAARSGVHAGHKLRYEPGATPDVVQRVCTVDGAIINADLPRCTAIAAGTGERCKAPARVILGTVCSRHASGIIH